MSLWWVFDKQLWFNLKRIQARIFIYLFPTDEWTFKHCPFRSIDDTITIIYGYMGIMGYELQRIP